MMVAADLTLVFGTDPSGRWGVEEADGEGEGGHASDAWNVDWLFILLCTFMEYHRIPDHISWHLEKFILCELMLE